ncbi:MAG: peptidoglycan-binding protein [Actinomycetota bacterium]
MPVLSNTPDQPVTQPSPAPAQHVAVGEVVPHHSADEPAPRRSRRTWFVVASGLVVAAVAVAIVVLALGGDSTTDDTPTIALQAVTAETADLVEFTDLDGTLRYANTTTVTAASDGVVTELVESGQTVVQGDEIYALNGVPAVVFYGDVPLYRELGEGAAGDDVLLLEQNLAALGYHFADVDDDGDPVDEEFLVDGVFDTATTDAVVRWQEDLGVEATGIVGPGAVVVLGGPSEVIDVDVSVGDQVQLATPVVGLNEVAAVSPGVFANSAGEVELLVAPDQPLHAGDVVYSIDGVPVTAVVTNAEFERDLSEGVDDGADVAAIEEMLLALGYDAGGDLVVDETFDEATEEAVIDWQADLENTFEAVDVDGEVALDQIVVVEPGSTVGALLVESGDVLASGSTLWTTSVDTTERIVETAIAVADQDQLAEGTVVDVEFPDGEIVAGTVQSLATSSAIDPMDETATATLAVEIVLPAVPETVADLNEIDVVVKLVDEIAEGVTVVPASALVAVGDGRYAVEVVTAAGTEFVAVTPGMFSDGQVEVDGIAAGTQVVIPS